MAQILKLPTRPPEINQDFLRQNEKLYEFVRTEMVALSSLVESELMPLLHNLKVFMNPNSENNRHIDSVIDSCKAINASQMLVVALCELMLACHNTLTPKLS